MNGRATNTPKTHRAADPSAISVTPVNAFNLLERDVMVCLLTAKHDTGSAVFLKNKRLLKSTK